LVLEATPNFMEQSLKEKKKELLDTAHKQIKLDHSAYAVLFGTILYITNR
jgi:hypothetical protein